MSGSSVTFQKTTKEATTSQVAKKMPKVKTQQARTSVFDCLGSTSQPTIQRTITQDTQSFRAESGQGGRRRPSVPPLQVFWRSSGSSSRPTLMWLVQVGAAGVAPQWQSLLGSYRATYTVKEGVGLNFQHWPQLTHQSIAFHTRNSRQDLQQAVDALLS